MTDALANNPPASPHRPPTPMLRISSGGMDCVVCDAAGVYDAIKKFMDKCKPEVLGVLIRVDSGKKVLLFDTVATLQKIGENGWKRIKIK